MLSVIYLASAHLGEDGGRYSYQVGLRHKKEALHTAALSSKLAI